MTATQRAEEWQDEANIIENHEEGFYLACAARIIIRDLLQEIERLEKENSRNILAFGESTFRVIELEKELAECKAGKER